MESIFGGFIEFENQAKLKEFIDSLDKNMSIKIIEASIEYAVKNGLYSLEEIHCLYHCLNKLKENGN
jgi:hypothetical protein